MKWDLLRQSDDFLTDAYIASDLVWLARLTGMMPDIRFAKDSLIKGPALAVRPGKPLFGDGMIVFSRTPLGTQRSRGGREPGILTTVAAHEFGHLLQFQQPVSTLSTHRLCELHADFLAGFLLVQHADFGSADQLASLISHARTSPFTRHYQRRVAMLAGIASWPGAPDSVFRVGEEVVASLADTIINPGSVARWLAPTDFDSAALAQIEERSGSETWSADFAGPIVEVRRRYHNRGPRTVVVAMEVTTAVTDSAGAEEDVAVRALQHVLVAGETKEFVLRVRGYRPPDGSPPRVTIDRNVAFLDDVPFD